MENFEFSNPVKILFGKGQIANLKNEIPDESRILLIYGGGSIKANGVYDQVKEALAGLFVIDFSGIEPNPHYETCLQAVNIIHSQNINFILAVGGGSVIDATKFISAAACYKGADSWDILEKHASIAEAVPFGTVLTLPATGSEMNSGAVITRASDKNKLAFASEKVYPKFSILDPSVTFSLPAKQIGNGVVDTFVHVVEQYVTYPANALIQDYFAESVLKTLLLEGPKALQAPYDYDVRANLMWASTWALNGWIGIGVPNDWATHGIGHELTAFYGLDHGQTLAIVLPGVLRVLKEQKAEKIIRLGEQVFGIYNNLSHDERIEYTIQAIESFFEEMGVKTHLSDYGLGADAVEAIYERLKSRGWKLGEKRNITADLAKEILLTRL
ncbi:MAG: iron-containing alcohol dehydrogenase [Bacteroidetes bacterium]|nr:iron-containing alcohol dehydrogenase [Bacteroidota bacterium]